jgi:hypothetical protein
MTRYRIELMQTCIEKSVVFIEANNPDEAERLALREAAIGFAEFRFHESGGDIEVIAVEELK